MAIINACKKIFPKTIIKICYFHFSNNIKKRINNLVFKDLFNSNPIAIQYVFGCKTLSFIPDIYIIPVFESLLETAHQLNDINLTNFIKWIWNKN